MTATSAFAQDDSDIKQWREQRRQKEAALQEAADVSESAKALKKKVEQGDRKPILEAGGTGDRTLIPYLKLLAADDKLASRNATGSEAFYAHAALGKLGDKEALKQIFEGVDALNPAAQDASMHKLALIGTKEAYRTLYKLLDDNAPRGGTAPDIGYFPRAQGVMFLLGEIVADPPRLANGNVNVFDANVWKAWFAKNKHLIE